MTEQTPAARSTKRRPAQEQDRLIEGAVRAVGRPVSAYEIIDHLRNEVRLAPQTVYRALDRLIARGCVHRLESLNAFVACSQGAHDDEHDHDSHTGTAVFAICDSCRTVEEFDDAETIAGLSAAAQKSGFAVDSMTLELRGRCAKCESSAPATS